MGRDNLYERMHGLPKEYKEQTKKRKALEKEYVSAVNFLPNSVMRSPQKKEFSQTMKT
jgi:hypothetical protein